MAHYFVSRGVFLIFLSPSKNFRMKILITLLAGALLSSGTPSWNTDYTKAKAEASATGRQILINFSGSDWCGPCIRLHKEIFEGNSFTQYAGEHLVLVNADFPRLKKHELSKDQQKKNDQLADKYNKDGIFPLTVLL